MVVAATVVVREVEKGEAAMVVAMAEEMVGEGTVGVPWVVVREEVATVVAEKEGVMGVARAEVATEEGREGGRERWRRRWWRRGRWRRGRWRWGRWRGWRSRWR
jgi:hypothetical protein